MSASSPLGKEWDVDALTAAYAFSPPPAQACNEDGSGCDASGGLSPEPDDGSSTSWQNEFDALESRLGGILRGHKSQRLPRSRVPPPFALSLRTATTEGALACPRAANNPLKARPSWALPAVERAISPVGGRLLAALPRPLGTTVGTADYRGHGAAGATTSAAGQTTADMGNGVNMDKRRCRQLHRDDFIAAIAQYRATQSDSTALMHEASDASAPALVRRGPSMSGGLGSVRGWVRKRPLLPHEEAGRVRCVSVARKDLHRLPLVDCKPGIRSVGSNITTHCCLLKRPASHVHSAQHVQPERRCARRICVQRRLLRCIWC